MASVKTKTMCEINTCTSRINNKVPKILFQGLVHLMFWLLSYTDSIYKN